MNPIEPVSPSRCASALVVPELSVVIPTFNERSNIPILVDRLEKALAGTQWEVIFDDDSPDGTAAAAKEPCRLHSLS